MSVRSGSAAALLPDPPKEEAHRSKQRRQLSSSEDATPPIVGCLNVCKQSTLGEHDVGVHAVKEAEGDDKVDTSHGGAGEVPREPRDEEGESKGRATPEDGSCVGLLVAAVGAQWVVL